MVIEIPYLLICGTNSVAMLNVDDPKVFENSVFDFYGDFHEFNLIYFNRFVFGSVLVLDVLIY